MKVIRWLAVVAAVAALAGCSGANPPHHTVAVHASSPPPSCRDQAAAWRDTADPQMHALLASMRQVSNAGKSLGKAQAAATRLKAAAQALLGDLPPACVTGARTDLATGLHDFIAAADSINLGTTTALHDADAQINAGSAAVERAISDLREWLP